MKNRVSLKEAIRFHGHIGPYLVLGLLAGDLALKKLRCKKYFGLEVKVCGANKKPKSCLIDGIQLATGATYGKGNIEKLNSNKIKIDFVNKVNNRKISLQLERNLIRDLEKTKTHKDSESLARRLYKTNPSEIFNIQA